MARLSGPPPAASFLFGFAASATWPALGLAILKKSSPFQCEPVIILAIALNERKTWPSYSNPSSRTTTWYAWPR